MTGMPVEQGQSTRRRSRRVQLPLDPGRIRAVVAYIERDPRRWNQTTFLSTVMGTQDFVTCAVSIFEGKPIKLLHQKPAGYLIRARARHLLGLTDQQAGLLTFYGHDWLEHPTVQQLKDYITETTGVTFP